MWWWWWQQQALWWLQQPLVELMNLHSRQSGTYIHSINNYVSAATKWSIIIRHWFYLITWWRGWFCGNVCGRWQCIQRWLYCWWVIGQRHQHHCMNNHTIKCKQKFVLYISCDKVTTIRSCLIWFTKKQQNWLLKAHMLLEVKCN